MHDMQGKGFFQLYNNTFYTLALLLDVSYSMTIITWITINTPSLGPIIILVTRAIVVNISTYVNLFILDVILLIILLVVDPKLMDQHIGCVFSLNKYSNVRSSIQLVITILYYSSNNKKGHLCKSFYKDDLFAI